MLRSIENICSYVQCRWRNVWRVYIDFNTLSCLNYFVQRVWGVYKMVVEIPKGWGGYFSGQKMEIPGRRGDLTWNSLRWWGYGYFLELQIHREFSEVATMKVSRHQNWTWINYKQSWTLHDHEYWPDFQGFDLVPRVFKTEFKKLLLAESIAPQPPNLLPPSS